MSDSIQSELSRFEEEVSKLTAKSSSAIVSSKPKINIQLSSFSTQIAAPKPPSTSYHAQPPPPAYPPNTHYGMMAHSMSPYMMTSNPMSSAPPAPATSGSGGVKRDVSGNTIKPGQAGSHGQQATNKPNKKLKESHQSAEAEKKNKIVRAGGGQVWEDPSLAEWDPDDFRLFCGDLGNEVTDEALARAFSKYPTFQRAKVIRDKRTGKSKGYGFVSFKGSDDFIKAMREMNGKYIGNRPIKLRKSNWKDRNIDTVKKKEAEKKKMGMR